MSTIPLLPVVALALLAWFAFRAEGRRKTYAPCTVERVFLSLGERLKRGEITPEEYRRLVVLMR